MSRAHPTPFWPPAYGEATSRQARRTPDRVLNLLSLYLRPCCSSLSLSEFPPCLRDRPDVTSVARVRDCCGCDSCCNSGLRSSRRPGPMSLFSWCCDRSDPASLNCRRACPDCISCESRDFCDRSGLTSLPPDRCCRDSISREGCVDRDGVRKVIPAEDRGQNGSTVSIEELGQWRDRIFGDDFQAVTEIIPKRDAKLHASFRQADKRVAAISTFITSRGWAYFPSCDLASDVVFRAVCVQWNFQMIQYA